jgi:hypothetical protein
VPFGPEGITQHLLLRDLDQKGHTAQRADSPPISSSLGPRRMLREPYRLPWRKDSMSGLIVIAHRTYSIIEEGRRTLRGLSNTAMKRWVSVVGAAMLGFVLQICILVNPGQAVAGQETDKLSEMFTWWNEAMKTPGALTEKAFSRYFTPDGALVIDGTEVMRTPAGWASRFQKIQAATDAVEIVLPFRYVFQKGDQIYTYHVIRSRAAGKLSCMLAAGHADLRDGLISKVTLVRAEIDPASDPDCWKQ